MYFPDSLTLRKTDKVNDQIWNYLQFGDLRPLELLDPGKFSIEKIKKEISTGCSPCPDILTEDFGVKPSVLFISTVYGLIYKYLNVEFDRTKSEWPLFCHFFYHKIIQAGIGIYPRLSQIYNMVSLGLNMDPEFCFTELVKAVLVDKNDKVSGLETRESFLRYFLQNEINFLQERINDISGKCVVFPCSELSAFFTLTTFGQCPNPFAVRSLPDTLQLIYSEQPEKKIQFSSERKRTGNYNISLSANGSYTNSIAFRTIFKIRDKDSLSPCHILRVPITPIGQKKLGHGLVD